MFLGKRRFLCLVCFSFIRRLLILLAYDATAPATAISKTATFVWLFFFLPKYNRTEYWWMMMVIHQIIYYTSMYMYSYVCLFYVSIYMYTILVHSHSSIFWWRIYSRTEVEKDEKSFLSAIAFIYERLQTSSYIMCNICVHI